MKSKLKIALKPGEKIYVNGAVISVDRKVSLEFLNDVQFLLQNHVMQPEDATSPLRQLYFIVQIILMNPDDAAQARDLFRNSLPILLDTFTSESIRSTLKDVDRMVAEGETFEALRTIRGLFGEEVGILKGTDQRAEMAPLEAAE
ncbi:flagellar biosynthesis repressor FlbT [Tianweitania sediminis]|jgi:flagellar protein FlbT|uniref:Probable flagellum biosynthesis repressor protein FlbT n=1 Tax=Tianweitania sediminis TaxID=1502156 RepID=A0A8J7R4V6_9HYPH|nr:flagellar biosynthesis repressor FlbT [Tianweitania sediminis]MBP0441253.1 flagellar biosynthesis repressor FlbT [Tianweitania sediminis]HEV7417852.1 flagellar biosynthesis repressor FlbT [Tianweitania sediminis]